MAESSRNYRFRGFTLNVDEARLFKHSVEVDLRPKSIALLVHLVRNADRLLTKDELLNAVWPGVHVTEDSLTQCVRDIRRALDDTDQSLLRTLPRRGYVFPSAAFDAKVADRPAGGVPGKEHPRRRPGRRSRCCHSVGPATHNRRRSPTG